MRPVMESLWTPDPRVGHPPGSDLYRRLFDRLPMPLAVLSPCADGELDVVMANPALARRMGVAAGDLLGKPMWTWITEDQRGLVQAGLEAVSRGEISALREECRLASRLGDIPIILEAALLGPGEVVVNLVDITDLAAVEQSLQRMAFHDALTGVANRTLLFDRLDHALSRRHPSAALLIFDLDGFKQVNDSRGHAAGDEVLVAVARRLEDCVRDQDTVARLGGDEFAILLEDGFGQSRRSRQVAARAHRIAARASSRLAEPIALSGGGQVVVEASVGIALLDHVNTATRFMADADARMYAAKRRRHTAAGRATAA